MKREGLYVRSVVLDGLLEYVDSMGGNSMRLAREVGLNAASRTEKVSFVSWTAICNFFEKASQELGEPYFGLKWALKIPDDFRSSGPNILLAMTVKDMREFVNLAIKYQKIHTNGVIYHYAEDHQNDEIIGGFTVHSMSPPCRQYSEHIMAVMAQMGLRNVPGFSVKKVSFQHRPLGDMTWYDKALGCPVEFNADKTEFITARKIFDIPLGGKLAIGRPLLNGYLNHQLSKKNRYKESMEVMVSGILLSMLGVHKSDLESVAKFLDLNPKKLQRLLKDEVTSYSQILDDTRQSIAKRLLRDSDISIRRMAGMLDYKSSEAFIAAAKRWFGKTPSKYRSFMRVSS